MSVSGVQPQRLLPTGVGDDAQHQFQHQGSIHLPPSPTLTNPEMILPEDVNERESSTPSPPFQLPSLSNMHGFYGNELSRYLPTETAASRMLQKDPPRYASSWTTPDIGRRLSDIGEEESPCSPVRSEAPEEPQEPQPKEGDAAEWGLSYSRPTAGGPGEPVQQDGQLVSHNAHDASNTVASSAAPPTTGEELPSSILSSEAERILENAKKRLTV